MKNILCLLVVSSLVSVSAYAEEVENAAELKSSTELGQTHEKESKFYVATKGLVTLGNSIKEEDSTLDGGTGYGLGIDLGYRIRKGLAVELDGTYTQNTITEVFSNGDKEDLDGSYATSSLDIVYEHKLIEKLAVFAKGGVEYEREKITHKDSKITQGYSYSIGSEYEVSESMAILAEYEGTTIDGPRGNGIFAGVVYNF